MAPDPVAALHSPGHLRFSSNRELAKRFEPAGGRVTRLPTGHLVFYRPDGRRFLATDPAGHPLHECEWETDGRGRVRLARARLRLDWGQWVGIRPEGLVNETTLNLATKPGWQRVTPDDLRAMAAQALRVPIDEVRWFYRDEDLAIDARGMATIRHRKDAFHALEDGGFERARFMSCMGAMHWDRIDFLPVVELFKSLLPGTGAAAFELIRGLYDDQNPQAAAPHPLRYRGIPTYPSEAAYRLFCAFFAPQAPAGGDALSLFMDPARSHHVVWLPRPHPPVRYVDPDQGLCVTVQQGVVQKATLADDRGGAAYVNPAGRRVVPLDRSLRVDGHRLVLRDREEEKALALPQSCGAVGGDCPVPPVSPVDWRSVFVQGMPSIPPAAAYGAVLLYPDDEQEIGELAAQPFVADYLQDVAEQDREIGTVVSQAESILIHNADAVIATCIPFDRPRSCTVHVRHPAFAQRQAQQLWTQCAEAQRWEWLERIRFVVHEETPASRELRCDVAYAWLPYETFGAPPALTAALAQLGRKVKRGGTVFLVGPGALQPRVQKEGFQLCWEEAVERLPTFRMHRTILPKARLIQGLTLYQVKKL